MTAKVALITGAAGFVGRYVTREFAAGGYKVFGMGWGKFQDYMKWGLSSWREAEISLETLGEFAGKLDVIVHCAGGASVEYSVEHPRQDFSMTVDSASCVLEFLRLRCPECRLVYPSSAAVYGQTKAVPISESTTFNPVSPYGVHKSLVETLCRMYASRYGLSISIVRLFSIYGKGLRKQLLWDACNKFSQDNAEFFGSGEEVRDWLHVTDAAKLLFLAHRHASNKCPVVNGGAGVGVMVKDVVRFLASVWEVQKEPVFTSVRRTGDPDVLLADSSLAESWGWKPSVGWQKGVAEYVRWCKRQRKN